MLGTPACKGDFDILPVLSIRDLLILTMTSFSFVLLVVMTVMELSGVALFETEHPRALWEV